MTTRVKHVIRREVWWLTHLTASKIWKTAVETHQNYPFEKNAQFEAAVFSKSGKLMCWVIFRHAKDYYPTIWAPWGNGKAVGFISFTSHVVFLNGGPEFGYKMDS